MSLNGEKLIFVSVFVIKVKVSLKKMNETDQVDGSLVEGGSLQDLLHGDRLQFIWIQVFTRVRYTIVHDYRQWTHPRLLIVSSSFL